MSLSSLKRLLETNIVFREVFANNKDLSVLSDEDIEYIHSSTLDMMKDIDEVCEKNNLTYFLGGGSCLGAVRHKGFIPWDDDMDIIMPRQDYDKIADLVVKDFPDKYWIQEARHSDKYNVNSMKIRLKNSTCLELFETEPEKAGIFIDIYPLEDTSDGIVLRKIHGYLDEFCLLVCSCVRMKNNSSLILPYLKDKNHIKTVKFKSAIGKCLSFIPENKWIRLTEKVLSSCKNSDSEFVTIPTGRKHYFGEMYSRASFFPPKKVAFENTEFYIMNNPDEYLTELYGEYSVIPNENYRDKHAVKEFHHKK